MSELPIPLNRNQRLDPGQDRDARPESETGSVITLADYTADAQPRVDPATGDISVDTPDGGVVVQIDPSPEPEEEDEDKFYRNLAGVIDDAERNRIVNEVMEGIEADNQTRQEWLDTRAEGIKMLGTALEKATGDVGAAGAPFEGMSTVRHPLLLESIVKFQSNAAAELYPPTGPVKVRDDRPVKPDGTPDLTPVMMGHNGGPSLGDPPDDDDDEFAGVSEALALINPPPPAPAQPPPAREALAEALERGFNHNLTVVDRGYRPDSVRMLFWVGFGGCGFKKVYDCPIKGRPISRYVDAEDLIVNNAVSDHRDAERVTHRIRLRSALVRRMQIAGVYRDVSLHEPQFEPDAVDEAKAAAQGLQVKSQRQEDQPHTLYESYVELDVRGYEHKKGGKPTGIPLPYKMTIDKDSRQLLELRRNWDDDDDTYTPRQVFVKFGFIPAMGFYDLGLLHLLGNGDKALTAAWREALDAGMFGNFPGFIYNEGVIRNWTNQNRVPPGGGIGVKGVGNLPLDQIIKPLPYKDVGPGMIGLIQHLEQRMDRVAGTGDMPVGEGRQDAPVGTTLALLEQATKVLAAVHVGLHASQAEELELLKQRYEENPEAFWRWNKKKSLPKWEVDQFLAALEDNEIVPAADPNTPSHMIRLIRCQAVKMVAMQRPDLYDMRKVDRWIFGMIGVSDPDQFFAPPPDPNAPPPLDPMAQATLAGVKQKGEQAAQEGQLKLQAIGQKGQESAMEHQARLAEIAAQAEAKRAGAEQQAQQAALQSADRAADRQSEERRDNMRLAIDQERFRNSAEHDAERAQNERVKIKQDGLASPPPSSD